MSQPGAKPSAWSRIWPLGNGTIAFRNTNESAATTPDRSSMPTIWPNGQSLNPHRADICGGADKHADLPRAVGLLSARRHWPRRSAPDPRDELPSSYHEQKPIRRRVRGSVNSTFQRTPRGPDGGRPECRRDFSCWHFTNVLPRG
jgi:hypothetical protein